MRRTVTGMVLLAAAILAFTVPAAAQDDGPAGNVTRAEAVQAIDEADLAIQDMRDANYSTQAVRALLDRAEQALRRADLAEVLRTNASGEVEEQARDALAGLDWEGFTYADVLTHTRRIQDRHDTAFRVDDQIRATRIAIREARDDGVNVTGAATALADARTAFREERYDDAFDALDQADTALNDARARQSALDVIAARSTGFIAANWRWLLPVAILLVLLTGLAAHAHRLRRMRRELRRLTARKAAIDELIAETQEAYYGEEEMPEVVYDTRMDRYREAREEVERSIPVLEEAMERERLFSTARSILSRLTPR